MRLIDGDALYAKLQEYEELARKRVWDTESTLPFPTNLNPAYTRYLAQLDERTAMKHMVADAQLSNSPKSSGAGIANTGNARNRLQLAGVVLYGSAQSVKVRITAARQGR